jgi:predicted nucleotidyltransferase
MKAIPSRLKKEISLESLLQVCQSHRISRLYLFGSFLTGKDTAKSDVDLIVKFKDADNVSMLDLIKAQRDLRRIFKKPVDLITTQSISPYFRQKVLRSMQLIYEN